jgi:hypothetical protein
LRRGHGPRMGRPLRKAQGRLLWLALLNGAAVVSAVQLLAKALIDLRHRAWSCVILPHRVNIRRIR